MHVAFRRWDALTAGIAMFVGGVTPALLGKKSPLEHLAWNALPLEENSTVQPRLKIPWQVSVSLRIFQFAGSILQESLLL
jgi:hypothetical protein